MSLHQSPASIARATIAIGRARGALAARRAGPTWQRHDGTRSHGRGEGARAPPTYRVVVQRRSVGSIEAADVPLVAIAHVEQRLDLLVCKHLGPLCWVEILATIGEVDRSPGTRALCFTRSLGKAAPRLDPP